MLSVISVPEVESDEISIFEIANVPEAAAELTEKFTTASANEAPGASVGAVLKLAARSFNVTSVEGNVEVANDKLFVMSKLLLLNR